MNDNRNDLFIDKIKLSSMVVLKEATLIAEFNSFISDIKHNMFKTNNQDMFLDRINKDHQFINIMAYIKELWDILEFNKIEDLKISKSITSDDIKDLKDFIEKYTQKPLTKFDYETITKAYNQIRKVVSKSGYHEDTKTDTTEMGWDE